MGLPRYATELELQSMAKTPLAPPLFGQTDPPEAPVRAMAEWEELQALVITWRSFPTILTEIVRAARKECRVIINCDSPANLLDAQSVLSASGVDTSSNVEFVLAPNNSIWVRDYGPNCVYANDVDSLYFVDWRYNRTTRRRDDSIATTLAPYFGAALYSTSVAPNDLVNTGGNFMSDGMGTAFASDLILDENAPGNIYGASVKDEAQIDGIMQQYMGIDRFIKMEKLPFDGIHHIDMHMKLLDEQRLLVGQYPLNKADGPQIEANIQYVIQNFQNSFGDAYDVTRIPMPPDGNNRYPDLDGDYRTYANAVFVNKTILVPFYAAQYDTTARRIWQNAMPGYNIVGIDCNDIIPLLGAIHCITKEIGVADPLRIVHKPIKDVLQSPNSPIGYPISATIQHRSGIASARIWYTLDTTAAWQAVDMSPSISPDTTDVWEVVIPRIDDAVGKFVY
ncbi:MAG: agmatine deiminase family protein, partial [Saprospiraceae bacterium]